MNISICVDNQTHPWGSKVVLFPGDNQRCLSCDASLDLAGQRAVSLGMHPITVFSWYKLNDPEACPGCGELITHYRDINMTNVHIKQLC